MIHNTLTFQEATPFASRFYNDDNWDKEIIIVRVDATGVDFSMSLARHNDADDDEMYVKYPLESSVDESRMRLIIEGLRLEFNVMSDPNLGRTVKEPHLGNYDLKVLDTLRGDTFQMKQELADYIMYRLKPSDIVEEFMKYYNEQQVLNELVDGRRYAIRFRIPSSLGFGMRNLTRPILAVYRRKDNKFTSIAHSVPFDEVHTIYSADEKTLIFKR